MPAIFSSVLTAGEFILHNDIVYKTLLTHFIYQETTSDFSVFFQQVANLSDILAGTVPDFIQPTGAHDAYSKGVKVTYKGKVYISLIDNNVWAPDVYPQGWSLVS